MPESYKRLGAVAPTDNKEYLLYAAPDATQSLISNITVANRSSSSASFDINVYESGVTQQSDLDDVFVLPPTYVALASGSAAAATSTDGITWTARTLPASEYWNSVTYGNGTFVAVLDGLSTATSTDGITWNASTMPSNTNWYSVTYGNGTFVAVASNNAAAATSTDGITWTARTMPSTRSWYSVTYGDGTFVTVEIGSAAAASSTDGITWTARTLPSNSEWRSVTHGDGTFVAVAASSNTVATSPDGITWTARTLPSSDTWLSVTYGENLQPYSSPSLNNLYKSSLISANETQILEPGIALSASASIVAKDNSGGNLTFSTYGVELS